MGKEGSVAPKERINIVYRPETGGMDEDVELPFRYLVMGDFTGREEATPVEERELPNIDKDNFNEVLAAYDVGATISVSNELSEGDERDELSAELKFKTMRDFEPDRICQQVPELKKLIELRDALTTLKGPLGNIPGFRRRLQALLNDPDSEQRLIEELGLSAESDT